MAVKRLYDSEHLRVVYRPGSSSFALVSFNPATLQAKDDTFWCQPIADKADLTAIGVMTHRGNWYPVEEMRQVAELVRPLLQGFDRVLGYGSSMGGYGALKFSRLLGITHVLSFAPQWSIAPQDVGGWDDRFTHEFRPGLHTEVRIEPHDVAAAPIVFYDPFFKFDRLNVERIVAACPTARLVPTYLTGHFPVNLFAGTAKVMALFEACFAEDIPAITRQATRMRRDPATGLRARALADLYVQSNIDGARRLLARHPQAFGPRERAGLFHQMAGQFIKMKRFDDAATCSDAALADNPGVRDFYIRRCTIEQGRGDTGRAVSFAREAVKNWPSDAATHLQLSNACLKHGDQAGAEAALETASRLAPNSAAVINTLMTQATSRNDDAGAEALARRLVEVSPLGENYRRLAALLTKRKQHNQASDALRKAVDTNPSSNQLWRALAESHFREPRWMKAAEAAAEAVRLDESDLASVRIAAVAYKRMGVDEWARPYELRLADLERKRNLELAARAHPPAAMADCAQDPASGVAGHVSIWRRLLAFKRRQEQRQVA